jgi:metal-dependent hydrolase (beta-lactamase superfamily II)
LVQNGRRKITTLVGNRPSPDDPALAAEWGLSHHVEDLRTGSRLEL